MDGQGARRGRGRTPKRKRTNRWNLKRKTLFLATLAETANVAGSARAAAMSESAARQLKRRDAEFAAAWDAALCEGYGRLETMLLARALTLADSGDADGGKAGQMTERLALALLAQHRPRVTELRSVAGGESDAAAQTRLAATLETMRARLDAIDGGAQA